MPLLGLAMPFSRFYRGSRSFVSTTSEVKTVKIDPFYFDNRFSCAGAKRYPLQNNAREPHVCVTIRVTGIP